MGEGGEKEKTEAANGENEAGDESRKEERERGGDRGADFVLLCP